MRKLFVLMLATFVMGALPALAGWDEGVAAFTKRDFQTAQQEFQTLVDQSPDSWQGHYMLGLTLEQLKRQQESLNHMRKAYDLNPNEVSVKLALGRVYSSLKRYGDAGKLLSSVDASGLPAKHQTAFYQMRSKARMETNDVDGGLADLKSLTRLNPRDAKTQYNYGILAAANDRLDTAIDALGTASRLAPGDQEMKRAYITSLLKKGRTSRDKSTKLDSYKKAAALANELSGASATYDNLMLACSAQLGAKLYTEAVSSCSGASSKKSNDWLALYYTGQANTSAGRFSDAEQPLKDALTKTTNPGDLKKIWGQLGFTYEKEKDYAKSIEAYTNAGDQRAVTRVTENQSTALENEQIEAENEKIRQMQEEAKRLEEELKAIEGGGGGR